MNGHPLETVEVSAPGLRASVSGRMIHRCPFRDEEDRGEVLITWTCDGRTLELHSLAAYLATWERVVIAHEELSVSIRDQLEQLDGISDVTVTAYFSTAGLEVTCSTSPTL